MRSILFKASSKIGRRVKLSFLAMVAVIVFTGLLTLIITNRSIGFLDQMELIGEFRDMVKDAKTYSTNWVYVGSYEQDKQKLQEIHEIRYPALKKELSRLVDQRGGELAERIQIAMHSFDSIMMNQATIMESLNNQMAYEDAMTVFVSEDLVENDIIPESDQLIQDLDNVISGEKGIRNQMSTSFSQLIWVIVILGALGSVFAIVISTWLSRSITRPVNALQNKISQLRLGIIPDRIDKTQKDEIGLMSEGINSLIGAFSKLSDFATEIGKGNLDAEFQALSEQDKLGQALISMRENLKSVINETDVVIRTAGEEGKLNTGIALDDKKGAWKTLSEAINHLLESIAIPVLEVNRLINEIAMGDLSQSYELEANGDIRELKQALNTALSNLNDLLGQIAQSAQVVDESSAEMLSASEEMNANTSEIASAIAQMSSGAQNQVVKVDESSSLVEAILNTANAMEQKAETINEAAKSGVESSEKGRKMISNVSRSMNDISEFSHKTSDSIKVLTERSKEISRVLSVITDIASQTNLLALNAAIEAAQAGDAGRGFAVVAEEIRKLAEDSRKSAGEIENLIKDVQNDTTQASSIIDTMNKTVAEGNQASEQASEVFNEIAESTQRTLSSSEEIVTATKEQQESIGKVVTITESVVVIAEETAAGTEQVASSATELSTGMQNYKGKSEELVRVADDLKIGISKFKLRAMD